MISKSLAVQSQPMRVALLAMLCVAAMAGTLNGAVALSAWLAQTIAIPAPTPANDAEDAIEPETLPPAFQFDAPLPGRVVNSPFGLRQLPWEENGRLHEGVDIAAPSGASVRVAADGVVKRTGISPSYGRFVQVMHKGGLTTMYAHLARPARGVKPGAYLRRGQAVAFVGDTGHSTGSHLHFEIRQGGKPLNPSFFIGRSFAEAQDLPIKAAARVSRKVRLATVSKWPEGVVDKRVAKVVRAKAVRVKAVRVKTIRAKSARAHARIRRSAS